MMGPKQEAQGALFYVFSLEDHVPQDHLLRSIDRFVDLSSIRGHLADFYSHTGRPSADPELLIRMLLVGYPKLRRTDFRDWTWRTGYMPRRTGRLLRARCRHSTPDRPEAASKS